MYVTCSTPSTSRARFTGPAKLSTTIPVNTPITITATIISMRVKARGG
jgi:hypothetical protein